MPMIARRSFIWSRARAANIAFGLQTMPGTLWVKRTCHELIDEHIPVGSTVLSTDESNSYPGCHPTHGAVCHSAGEWARDDDGAEWIQGFIDYHCPGALRILDFPHAAERICQIGEVVLGAKHSSLAAWQTRQLHHLKQAGRLIWWRI
jgi:hypothetical protein